MTDNRQPRGAAACKLAFAALALALALALAACTSSAAPSDSSTTWPLQSTTTTSIPAIPTVAADVGEVGLPAFYTPPSPLPAGKPGALIRAEKVTGVPGVPAGTSVWRILFHSTSIYGADIAESGYVIDPAGKAPAGGWPMLDWAHGTDGFGRLCAPSLFTTQQGAGVYLIPGLESYLQAGFAIAATDYEGQGAPGVHGYLLGDEEGRGVLDAARAALDLPGADISNDVLIFGHSQGGQAALFAGQMAPSYAPELHVKGVVAAAPATSLSVIIAYGLSKDGSNELGYVLPAVWTWTQTYKDLPVSDIFTTEGAAVSGPIVTNGCQNSELSELSSRHLTASVIFKPDAWANPVVQAHAKENNPGLVKTPVPILVVQGLADQTVPPFLTDSFVHTAACPVGDTIEYVHVPGATHLSVVWRAKSTIIAWMQARLRGQAAISTCGRKGDYEVLGSA